MARADPFEVLQQLKTTFALFDRFHSVGDELANLGQLLPSQPVAGSWSGDSRGLADEAAWREAHLAAGERLVVVDFCARWCAPCQAIAPLLGELEKETPEVVFVKVDVDENEEVAMLCSISTLPTLCFMRGGNLLESLIGEDVRPDSLREHIARLK
ncbi:hypothetical protein AB1Y20_013261 [Prymnesium parvum]|uniref:Thioredoxin domain-containing protein n=1 Tax=Prymnesium parvum TaxID=97485 RepID=A0AB34IM81_PRYPA